MTQKHETPEEHSDLVGGSTAARRINCPRSYALEQLVPKDGGNVYTHEGTALHEVIAKMLDMDVGPLDILPFTFKREGDDVEGDWEFTVTPELWADVGQPALDAFDAFAEEIEAEQDDTFEFIVEKRCAMPGIDGAFGTSDVIWKCGDLSGVWDWKFGRRYVSAEENAQLMFYARAAMADFPEMFGSSTGWGGIDPDREVILSIMQPRRSEEPDEYVTNVRELEQFRSRLMEAVAEIKEKGDKAEVARGPWCDFATCKAVCPLWAGRTVTMAEKLAKINDGVAAVPEKADESDAFVEALPELLDMAEAAEGWVAEIRKAARRTLDDGVEIEGWRIGVSKSSRREWAVSDDEVAKFFKNRRYRLDDFMPRKLLTMPAAEKVLKADGRTIPDEMINKKVSTKEALVRDDSALPPPEMSSERAKALGDKLSALAGGDTTEG